MIRFELLEERHIGQILDLERICFPEDPWSREMFESELDNQISVYLVAIDLETELVIGYAGVWLMYDIGNITNVAVRPEYRGEGLAVKMLRILTAVCRERGMAGMTLEVRKGNLPAQNLYQKMGFVPCGERKRYYQNQEDAVIMSRELGGEEDADTGN